MEMIDLPHPRQWCLINLEFLTFKAHGLKKAHWEGEQLIIPYATPLSPRELRGCHINASLDGPNRGASPIVNEAENIIVRDHVFPGSIVNEAERIIVTFHDFAKAKKCSLHLIVSYLEPHMKTIEEMIAFLGNKQEEALEISFNPHRNYSSTVEWYFTVPEPVFKDSDFISPEDRQTCIDNATFWEVKWYPHGHGFHSIIASTLRLALEYMYEEACEEEETQCQ
jgi:hypothetical protein